MAMVFKDKDGNKITRPITHPATDEQVHDQLKKLIEEGELTGTSGDNGELSKEVDALSSELRNVMIEINGLDAESTSPTWSINNVNDTTGAVVSDGSSAMRIVSNKLSLPKGTVVKFNSAATYYYVMYFYNYTTGEYIVEEHGTEWLSAPTYVMKNDRQVIIKVRHKSYAKWTEDTISEFSKTVEISKQGIVERVEEVENNANLVPELQNKVNENSATIEGVKKTLETFEGSASGENNVLLQYTDNFFDELENGEIGWQDGQNVAGNSKLYVRSVGYKYVGISGGLFVAKIPSTAIVSYYIYSKDQEDNYVWERVSEWCKPNSTFVAEEGKYYRILIHNGGNEISPNSVNVVLSGSVLQDIIDEVVKQYQGRDASSELDEELTITETAEMNATISSMKNFINPNTAQIAWFTDLHITANELTTTDDTVRAYSSGIRKHVTMFNKTCDEVKIDVMVFGGDYLNNTKNTKKDGAVLSYGILREYIDGARKSIPKAVCTGNHDDNSLHAKNNSMDATHYVDEVERWDLFHGLQCDDAKRDADCLDRTYGFYDIKNKKIRVFFLNTVDIPQKVTDGVLNYTGQYDTGFRQEQLQFVADHLKFDEAGWQVIFFQHHPMTTNTNNQKNVGVNASKGGDSMRKIITAFVQKTSGTAVCEAVDFESTVEYDFTQNKSNVVIACVAGHTHGDETGEFNGIQVITTKAILEGNSVYFVIDRKERKLHLICNSATANENNIGSDITYPY